MARPEKVAVVEEIAEKFRESSASVVTEYRGLTTAQLTTLRRALGADVTYRVAKNTLVKRAAADAGVDRLAGDEREDPARLRQGQQGPGDQGRLHGRSPADRP